MSTITPQNEPEQNSDNALSERTQQLEELCSEFEDRFERQAEQIGETQKKIAKLEKASKDFESSKREIERLGKNIEKIQTEADKLKTIKSEMNQLAEDLKGDLVETNTKIDKIKESPRPENKDWQTRIEKDLNRLQTDLKKLLSIHTENHQEQDIKSPKEKFRVEIAPVNGHNYRVVLSHPLSKEQKTVEGFDVNAMSDFFKEHLPELDEPLEPEIKRDSDKSPKSKVVKKETLALKSSSRPGKHGIEKIFVFQSDKSKSGRIEPNKSFSLETVINLTKEPNEDDLLRDIPVIGLSCSIFDKRSNQQVFTQNFEEQLRPGNTNYHSIHKLPPLNPGHYSVNIFAFAPFDHIADQQATELVVQ